MSTLIIGANGSMGVRYRSILKHLGQAHIGVDIHHSEETILQIAASSDRVILCTPTETHFQYLERLIPLKKPILCEKPITKSLKELETILALAKEHQAPFVMVYQYTELLNPHSEGKSYYHYFRSGRDGLAWDCLQIIGLAHGEVEISNNSPHWTCRINGYNLNFSDMDLAYVNFVRKWIAGKIEQDPEELFRIHQKTDRMHNELQSKLS